MRNFLRLLHLLAGAGFLGAVAAALLIAARAPAMSPTAFSAAWQLVEGIGNYIALPALTVLLVSGMLLVAARPVLLEARWVWAKATLGALTGAFFLVWALPGFNRAAGLASGALSSMPSFGELEVAIRAGAVYGGVALATALAASMVAVWRPRLGQGGAAEPPPDQAPR